MKEKTKNIILNVIGIFFIILGIFSSAYAIFIGQGSLIFWFCYVGIILLGIGIFKRSSYLILVQLNILLIPLLLWTIDFIFFLIFKKTFFGITNYFFQPQSVISRLISLQHLYTLPLGLFSLYLIKLKRKDAWKISLFQMIILFFITRIFTTDNINCVYKSCILIQINNPILYFFVWFIVAFILVMLSNLIMDTIKIFR